VTWVFGPIAGKPFGYGNPSLSEKCANPIEYYFYRARYYEPGIGRFTQVDPSDSMLGYYYASNNPLSYYDPYGLYVVSGMDKWRVARIDAAMQLLVSKIDIPCDCRKYFDDNGFDFSKAIRKGGGPVIVLSNQPTSICGATNGSTTTIYMNKQWFNSSAPADHYMPQGLASCLLHELRHIAYKSKIDDDTIQDAKDFFKKCKMGGIDPTRD
jgi:RHS repeat-associated protein